MNDSQPNDRKGLNKLICMCEECVARRAMQKEMMDAGTKKLEAEIMGSKAYAAGPMRTYDTGATRSSDTNKPDYEGFLSPLVIEAYGAYMHKHRKQVDGVLRESDNWQKGMSPKDYIKSMWRHFMQVWKLHRGLPVKDWDTGEPVLLIDAVMGLLFNVMGFAHEMLRAK